jgi:hypothetical protein
MGVKVVFLIIKIISEDLISVNTHAELANKKKMINLVTPGPRWRRKGRGTQNINFSIMYRDVQAMQFAPLSIQSSLKSG